MQEMDPALLHESDIIIPDLGLRAAFNLEPPNQEGSDISSKVRATLILYATQAFISDRDRGRRSCQQKTPLECGTIAFLVLCGPCACRRLGRGKKQRRRQHEDFRYPRSRNIGDLTTPRSRLSGASPTASDEGKI